ncbi:MAG: hypothetical protein C0399_09985 [Syntrophus sp. (in: bacteria)]|nr:hypothetical protein [Syntrophus sp. (in: bacteria)]MBA4418575.1 hypothetical protein [Syntrophus sp. (in: bacteria)]
METEITENEINLLDYVKVILRNTKLIVCIVVIVVVVTIIKSLLMAPVYEAKTVIIPAGVASKDSGMSSLMATQFGIAPPTAPISAEITNILKSNILKEKIIINNNLLPILLGPAKDDKSQPDGRRMWSAIRALTGMMKVNFTPKDNVIEISVKFKDPGLAADLLRYTLAELTNYMSSETKRVAGTNQKYLESQLDKVADPFIKAKIYGMIAQQMETIMMAEVKENFAFKVLDPPRVPDRKIGPKRVQMVMISFVVALFLGIFVAFGKEYVLNHKKELSELGREMGLSELMRLKWGRRTRRKGE